MYPKQYKLPQFRPLVDKSKENYIVNKMNYLRIINKPKKKRW
jgi:hypothetical protein